MKSFLKLLFPVIVLSLVLAACGSSTLPPLAVADQPTLVFIYTDG